MVTVAIICGIIATVIAHELGHAFAMRACGVRVETISLLGFPGLGTINLHIKSKWFPNTMWVVHPLVLGAYVEANEADMLPLAYKDQQYINGMGPMLNFIVGIPCMAMGIAVLAAERGSLSAFLFAAAVMIAACAISWLLWVLRRLLIEYAFMLIGGIALAFVFKHGFEMSSADLIKSAAGPLSTVAIVHEGSKQVSGTELVETISYCLFMTGIFSIGLGLLNLLPIPPLDGGNMIMQFMDSLLPKWASRVYFGLGTVCVAGILLLSLWNDAVTLFYWIF